MKILIIILLIIIGYILTCFFEQKEHFKGILKKLKPKLKIPKPPKFKYEESKVVEIEPNTGSSCDTDTLYDLKNRYKHYQKDECNYEQWLINPERCPASKEYLKKLYQFTENAMKDSKKDTAKNQILLDERIEDDEHLNLYPLNNYDFDYKTAMKKKYNIFKLGLTNKPTINNLIKSPNKMKPYISALLDKSYPDEKTTAGISDVILDDEEALEIKNEYNKLNEELPYPTFRKDYPECRYPTKGRYASSYFIKSGKCKTSIKNSEECEKKGYSWVENKMVIPEGITDFISTSEEKTTKSPQQENGSCYKPRFSYIDNSAKDIYGKFGLGPSMLNDIMGFAPDKIFNILAGYTVEGSGLLPCVDS